MKGKDSILNKFHKKAEQYAKNGDIISLRRIVLSYELFRESSTEPFDGSDDQMASIIEICIKNRRELH